MPPPLLLLRLRQPVERCAAALVIRFGVSFLEWLRGGATRPAYENLMQWMR
jgi:hypothetical protein